MFPDQQRQQQAGAGLPVALFIVTVLSLIVLGMGQLQESSNSAISLQIQSQRAFFAAETGAQVVLTQIMPEDSSQTIDCPTPSFQTIPLSGPGLSGCRASIQCNDNYSPIIKLESTGECGNGTERAIRTVKVRVQ